MRKRTIITTTVASVGVFAAVAYVLSGYLSPGGATEPSAEPEPAAESLGTEGKDGRAEASKGRARARSLPSRAEFRQMLLDSIRETREAKRTDTPGAKDLREALANRLESQLGRQPSDAEVEAEMQRLERVYERTNEDMFTRAGEGFEAVMAEGVADPDWTELTQEYLDEYLRHEGAQLAEVIEVTCTERVCRLRFEHESEEARKQFSDDVATSIVPGMNGGDMYMENADTDNSLGTNAYVTWRGDRLILMDVRDAMDQSASVDAEEGSGRG